MRIFVSYASQDKQRATALAARLESYGHIVFIDDKLRSGSDFSMVIGNQIDQADVVVVLWTKNSISSRWVLDEAERGRHKLKPVRFGVKPPLGFGAIHAPNLPLLCDPGEVLHAIGLGPARQKPPAPSRWL